MRADIKRDLVVEAGSSCLSGEQLGATGVVCGLDYARANIFKHRDDRDPCSVQDCTPGANAARRVLVLSQREVRDPAVFRSRLGSRSL